jgi:hypothetical protein
MKQYLGLTGITGIMIFTACAGNIKEVPLQWTIVSQPIKPVRLYLLIDYKAKALGGLIPEWVQRYERTGLPGIETMGEYQDKYMFISKNSGTNFKVLQQWASSFRISHDFARMVSSRIQDRLTSATVSYPDYEYGAFFEAVVKASSDAEYPEAVQETDFWLKKQYFKEDGITVDQEVYDFFILVSIDKIALKSQIDTILNDIKVAIPPTREQTAAINRVKGTFYEGF